VGHVAAGHAEHARVGLLGARDDLDQRGFAGAVLSHERVDFSRTQVERDAFEGPNARIGLGDAGGIQQQSSGHGETMLHAGD
jgi:hypothetical protein